MHRHERQTDMSYRMELANIFFEYSFEIYDYSLNMLNYSISDGHEPYRWTLRRDGYVGLTIA
jgi:hypothetical protein